MTGEMPKRGRELSAGEFSRLFHAQSSTVERLHAQSQAARWELSGEEFRAVVEHSAKKRFASESPTAQKLEQYLCSLHVEDLALAAACAVGGESAWEYFYATYRPYLRASAAAILRCSGTSPEATELADSLFADLHGLEGQSSVRSLFRYFHGRSSLKTWLRAVLAQRHIDALRARGRFQELPESDSEEAGRIAERTTPAELHDPHRERYVSLFSRALQTALVGLATP